MDTTRTACQQATRWRGRIGRERETVAATVALYCRHQHGGRQELCPECGDLLHYAHTRLERCPFGEDKPTCSNCLVHCYRPDMRQRIRAVMRYAGPRMLLYHPILAILHLLDGHLKADREGPPGGSSETGIRP